MNYYNHDFQEDYEEEECFSESLKDWVLCWKQFLVTSGCLLFCAAVWYVVFCIVCGLS